MMSVVDVSPQYALFQPFLEGVLHGLPHICFGGEGQMGTSYSPEDPVVFWLHAVDYIWTLWQGCNDYDGAAVASDSDLYDDLVDVRLSFASMTSRTKRSPFSTTARRCSWTETGPT